MITKRDFVPSNSFGQYVSPYSRLDDQIAIFHFLCKFFPADLVQEVLIWLGVMATYRFCCNGKLGALFKFVDYSDTVRRVQEVCLDPETGRILQNGDARAQITNTLRPNANYSCMPEDYKAFMIEKELMNSKSEVVYECKPCLFGQAQCSEHARYDRPYGIVKHVVSAIFLNICGYKDKNSPVWLATGGSELTGCDLSKADILKFFQFKEMILFPGAELYDQSKVIEQQIHLMGMKARTSYFMEKVEYKNKQWGDDISNYIISEINRGVHYKEAYERALDRESLALDWLSAMVDNDRMVKE